MSDPMPPFGDAPNVGAELPVPKIGGEAGFPLKLKGLAGAAALEAPKANAPVEVVGEAALDAPKEKVVGVDPAFAPNEKVVGEETDVGLAGLAVVPKPAKPEGDCEGCADASELKPPKGLLFALEAPNAGVPEVPNAGVLEAPNAGVLEAPNAGVLEAPNAGVLEAPNAGVLEAPNDGVLEAPNAGVLEAPNAGVLEAPKAGVLEAPNTGVLAAPNAGVLEAPKAGVLAAPNAGVFEAPPNDGVALLDPNVELPKRGDDPKAFVVPNPAVPGDGEGVDDVAGVESVEVGFKPNREVELDAGASELAF
jgi:hypothetical protein